MFKRGGTWWSCFRLNGRKIRRSLGTDNKKLATSIEGKLRVDVLEGRYFDKPIGDCKTFSDLFRREILIENEVMKNDEAIGIPIYETLRECLKKLHKVVDINKRVFPSQLDYRSFQRRVQRAFKEVCVKAGLEDFHWHDLRHDFASMLVQGGTGIYTVQRLLGHKDGRMTQRYAHLSGENLRQAIKVLDRGKENLGHNLDTVASGL